MTRWFKPAVCGIAMLPYLPLFLLVAAMTGLLLRTVFSNPIDSPSPRVPILVVVFLMLLVVQFYPCYALLGFWIKNVSVRTGLSGVLAIFVIPSCLYLFDACTRSPGTWVSLPAVIVGIPFEYVSRFTRSVAPKLNVDPRKDSLYVLTSPRGGYWAGISDMRASDSGFLVAVGLTAPHTEKCFVRFYEVSANASEARELQTIAGTIGTFMKSKSYWKEFSSGARVTPDIRDDTKEAVKVRTLFNRYRQAGLVLDAKSRHAVFEGFLAYRPDGWLVFYTEADETYKTKNKTARFCEGQWSDESGVVKLPWEKLKRTWPLSVQLSEGARIYYSDETHGPPLVVDATGRLNTDFIKHLRENKKFQGYGDEWGVFHLAAISTLSRTVAFTDYHSILFTDFEGRQKGVVVPLVPTSRQE